VQAKGKTKEDPKLCVAGERIFEVRESGNINPYMDPARYSQKCRSPFCSGQLQF
jgi:hypothetical protein